MKRDKVADEWKEKYLRALADYQNLEKQTSAWRQEFASFASVDLIRKLLEILDDLEKAQEHLKDEGLNLIIGKLHNILREEGLEELEVLDKTYDPATAEVVSTELGEEDHKVIKVLQKGYRLKDKILRPAKVHVWVKS